MGDPSPEYTAHALRVMAERLVPAEWVESAVAEPVARTPDPNDPDVERFYTPRPGARGPRPARRREHAPHALARGDRVLRPEHARRAMKLHIDKQADALYLRLDDSAVVESEEVSPGVVLDYNASKVVVGVEMLHLSERSSDLDLSALRVETV